MKGGFFFFSGSGAEKRAESHMSSRLFFLGIAGRCGIYYNRTERKRAALIDK